MKLLYFAWVRQKIGRSEEMLSPSSQIATVRDLAEALKARGGGYAEAFGDLSRLRAAVNQDHVALDTPVSPDDEVAFFPPVTGG
ncbi:MAG: molybdopterin converting factor subunit 1 [Alphaproteobacteria bacterium]|nr:molybdopterin converting factor subunit 1 [Alphaproteobacteria bacterium]